MTDTTTITPEERLERLVKIAKEALSNYKSAKKATQRKGVSDENNNNSTAVRAG